MNDLSKRLREWGEPKGYSVCVDPGDPGADVVRIVPARDLKQMWSTMTEAADALDARWQTMESAPVGDHSAVVDLWAQGKRYTDCFWGKSTYGGAGYEWVHQGGYDCDGPVMEPVPNPTHWHPLPSPPEDA